MRKILQAAFALGLLIIGPEAFAQLPPQKSDSADVFLLHVKATSIEKEILPNSSIVTITIALKLEFKNSGFKPLILLSERCPFCPGAVLTKTSGPAIGDNILFDQYYGPSISTAPEWKVFRASLNQSKPPRDLVQVILPGDSWVMEKAVVLRLPKKLERYRVDRPLTSWDVLLQSSPIWLRLKCDVWPFNVESDPWSGKLPFGRELQKRWRKYGVLQLKQVISEPIKLDLGSK
jgi:hypothetical protein